MGLWDRLLGRHQEANTTGNGVSRCRYVACPKCPKIYDKASTLSGWAFSIYSNAVSAVTGTRTCSCGYVMQVGDIYAGRYDLPRSKWHKMPAPVVVDDATAERLYLHGKSSARHSKELWRRWFRTKQEAEKYANSEDSLLILLSFAALTENLSVDQRLEIVIAAREKRYQIVPSINKGDSGFDLVFVE